MQLWRIPPPRNRQKKPTKPFLRNPTRKNPNPKRNMLKRVISMANRRIVKSPRNRKAKKRMLMDWIWWDRRWHQNHRRNHQNRRKRKNRRKRRDRRKPLRMHLSLATKRHWAFRRQAKKFTRISSRADIERTRTIRAIFPWREFFNRLHQHHSNYSSIKLPTHEITCTNWLIANTHRNRQSLIYIFYTNKLNHEACGLWNGIHIWESINLNKLIIIIINYHKRITVHSNCIWNIRYTHTHTQSISMQHNSWK